MRKIVDQCEKWLSDEVKKAGASGIILGLSGGIDSSVLAALAREALGRDGVLGVIMPCHSSPNDEADARHLAETLDVRYERVDLSGTPRIFAIARISRFKKLAKGIKSEPESPYFVK